jgi:hypothetical protein
VSQPGKLVRDGIPEIIDLEELANRLIWSGNRKDRSHG